MRFLTGIIAVAVAQIALIVYLSTEQQNEAVTRATIEATPVFDKTADLTLAPISNQDLLVVDGRDLRDDIASTVAKIPIYRQEKRVFSHPERPENGYPAETASFRKPLKVVVTDPYAGKPSSERRSQTSAVAKTTAKSENRSLIAKVLPIVKKPYDWLKAVGSKLR